MADPVAKALGACTAALRLKSGLTQEQLAERLKLTNETVSRFERGVTVPSIPTVASFARALGVELHVLFDLRGTTSARDKQLDALAMELRDSTPKQITLVREIAKTLKAQGALGKGEVRRGPRPRRRGER